MALTDTWETSTFRIPARASLILGTYPASLGLCARRYQVIDSPQQYLAVYAPELFRGIREMLSDISERQRTQHRITKRVYGHVSV